MGEFVKSSVGNIVDQEVDKETYIQKIERGIEDKIKYKRAKDVIKRVKFA